MQFLLALPLFALCLLGLNHLAALPAMLLASCAILGAIVTGMAANSERSWRVVVAGSAAALASVSIASAYIPAAGAIMLVGLYAPRALRTRSLHAAVVILAGAAAIGFGGAWIVGLHLHATLLSLLAAVTVAATLACAPMAVVVDDPLTFDLRTVSNVVPDPARAALQRAVTLRRACDAEALSRLSPDARRRFEASWTALRDLAFARHATAHRAAERIDARIRAHLAALERMQAAVDETCVMTAALADRTLGDLSVFTEALETEMSAIAEVVDPSPTSTLRTREPVVPAHIEAHERDTVSVRVDASSHAS